MVEYEVPDRLSILTYLSQFYQAFAGSQQNSPLGRSVNKRPLSTPEKVVIAESPPTKEESLDIIGQYKPEIFC